MASHLFLRNGTEARCRICNGYRIDNTSHWSLPTECPEKSLTTDQERDIFAKQLDYIDGKWWKSEELWNPVMPTALDGSTLEANVEYLLDRCPHTIPVKYKGGPNNVTESLIVTFMHMEKLIDDLKRDVVQLESYVPE